MTYDRVCIVHHTHDLAGADASHLAELVRGKFLLSSPPALADLHRMKLDRVVGTKVGSSADTYLRRSCLFVGRPPLRPLGSPSLQVVKVCMRCASEPCGHRCHEDLLFFYRFCPQRWGNRKNG
jgi:hypothetical protein